MYSRLAIRTQSAATPSEASTFAVITAPTTTSHPAILHGVPPECEDRGAAEQLTHLGKEQRAAAANEVSEHHSLTRWSPRRRTARTHSRALLLEHPHASPVARIYSLSESAHQVREAHLPQWAADRLPQWAADEVVCHSHFNCGARGRSHPHPLLAWYQVSYFVVEKIALLLCELMGGDPSVGQEELLATMDGIWSPDCLASDIPRSLKAPTVLESDCYSG